MSVVLSSLSALPSRLCLAEAENGSSTGCEHFSRGARRRHQGEGGDIFGRRLHLWEKAKGGRGPSGDHDHVDDGDDAVEVYSCGLELQI